MIRDIFDKLKAEEHPEIDPITHEDIFDRVAKGMTFPKLKVYVPPKRVELSPEQKEAVRREIKENRPERVTERVTEKTIEKIGPDTKQISILIDQAISKVQVRHAEATKQLEVMKAEYVRLWEELAEMKKNPNVEVRVLHAPFPNSEGRSGQFLTNDPQNVKWGPIYGAGDPSIPIGDPDTDGSWRIVVDGTALAVQKRESGVWVEKGAYTP